MFEFLLIRQRACRSKGTWLGCRITAMPWCVWPAISIGARANSRLARLAGRFGPEATLDVVLDRITFDCPVKADRRVRRRSDEPHCHACSRLSAPAPSAALVSGSLRADGDRMEEEGLSHVRAHHASTLRNRSSPLGEVGWIHMRGRLGRRGGRRGLSSSGGFPARVWPPEPSGSPVTSPGKAHDDRIRLSFAGMHGARISELGLGHPSASRGPGSWRS